MDPAKSHYAAASRVPLIQSPSLRVPRPVSNNPTKILDITGVFFFFCTGRTPSGHPSSPREYKRIRKWWWFHIPESQRDARTRTHVHLHFQFAYPFTLEAHILNVESGRRTSIAAEDGRHEAHLRAREEEKLRRKREALRRIAPGFEPRSAPLVPVKTGAAALGQEEEHQGEVGSGGGAGGRDLPRRDVMDDLVDRLAALDNSR